MLERLPLRWLLVLGIGVTAFGFAACADQGDPIDVGDATAFPTVTATSTATPLPSANQVAGADYRFEHLPATIRSGARLSFKNESNKEAHELVAIRLPDAETRPVAQLLQLPEAELNAVVGNAQPAVVFFAMPEKDGQPVVGTGAITERGRYAVVCFIPVGADPQKVLTAFQAPPTSGPPDLGEGPPHAAAGMYGEFRVE